MKIANPLYDNAFKFLMSNDRLARKVLSVILDQEVVELELAPQEIVVADEERRFTLYCLDFKAVIADAAGRRETVLIEIQKSKLPTNLLRFRNYLGLAYTQKTRRKKPILVGQEDQELPIIAIYILGYNIVDIPVLATKVDRKIIDLAQHKEMDIESDFIDLLTHTCYILQVQRLPQERRSRIEQFMSLFNQAWIQEDRFVLDLEDVPAEFQDIAEYLQRPLKEEELLAKLQAEEELETIFALQEAEREQSRAREVAHQQELEQERNLTEEERRLKEEALRQVAMEKERVLRIAVVMLEAKMPVATITETTGLTLGELAALKTQHGLD